MIWLRGTRNHCGGGKTKNMHEYMGMAQWFERGRPLGDNPDTEQSRI
jgi:hypothetical protein